MGTMKGELEAAALRLPGVLIPRTRSRPDTAVAISSIEADRQRLTNAYAIRTCAKFQALLTRQPGGPSGTRRTQVDLAGPVEVKPTAWSD